MLEKTKMESACGGDPDLYVEVTLNIYEEACLKYLNHQVVKRNFEKSYRQEIIELVECGNFDEELDSLHYPGIREVYRRWGNSCNNHSYI